jgi:hypothetical protein
MLESLEQLILVGDHQQLQASATIQALQQAPYFLNVSMFERLVNNCVLYTMLKTQRRMITKIRKLLYKTGTVLLRSEGPSSGVGQKGRMRASFENGRQGHILPLACLARTERRWTLRSRKAFLRLRLWVLPSRSFFAPDRASSPRAREPSRESAMANYVAKIG